MEKIIFVKILQHDIRGEGPMTGDQAEALIHEDPSHHHTQCHTRDGQPKEVRESPIDLKY